MTLICDLLKVNIVNPNKYEVIQRSNLFNLNFKTSSIDLHNQNVINTSFRMGYHKGEVDKHKTP